MAGRCAASRFCGAFRVTIPNIAMNAKHRIIAMPNTLLRIATVLLTIMVFTGCGQKGPLFLPGDPNEVRTTTPQQSSPQSEERDEDDEDEDGF